MGVMEVQIRDSRPEPILILPPASASVDGPVVRFVPIRIEPLGHRRSPKPGAESESVRGASLESAPPSPPCPERLAPPPAAPPLNQALNLMILHGLSATPILLGPT